MADIFLGEFDLDILPPIVTNRFPLPSQVDVDLFTNVSFDIVDQGGSDVDLASLNVTINGQDAVVAGSLQLGYGGSINPIANGFSVLIDPDDPLTLDSLITVAVDAQDQASIPNIMPTDVWSFVTSEGLIVSPVLAAFPGSQVIQLSWFLPPPTQMLQELFQLRKSQDTFPTQPTDGELVYEGTERQFLDTEVVNGIRYYYTIFVIRRFASGVPDYVPYEQPASATAVARDIVISGVILDEYVPERGEFGVTSNPLPHGTRIATWGQREDDVRRQSDLVTVASGRSVHVPMRGTVVTVEDTPEASPSRRLRYVEVANDRGLVVRVFGFLPNPEIIPGLAVEAGQVMGQTLATNMELAVFKSPVGNFGLRTVRPSYFFLTAEQRDGRT